MRESKNRVEAISDAIFAFAATLVVVSLEVPDDFSELHTELRRFFPFAISFFALVMVWRSHYVFFRRTDVIDGWIVGFNFALLFVVLFFVYPLKFLANLAFGQARIENFGQLGELFALYGGGLSAIFLFLTLMYVRAAGRTEDAEEAAVLRFWASHFFLFVIVGAISIGLALAGVGLRYGVPGFVYALLGPACYLHGVKKYPVTEAEAT